MWIICSAQSRSVVVFHVNDCILKMFWKSLATASPLCKVMNIDHTELAAEHWKHWRCTQLHLMRAVLHCCQNWIQFSRSFGEYWVINDKHVVIKSVQHQNVAFALPFVKCIVCWSKFCFSYSVSFSFQFFDNTNWLQPLHIIITSLK